MATEFAQMNADAAGGAVRKHEDHDDAAGPPQKMAKLDDAPSTSAPPATTEAPITTAAPVTTAAEESTASEAERARKIRLDQNRKAARESRRRKKVMIEELQRSVIFFSRANGTLKQQNEELSRLLIQAQAHIARMDGKEVAAPVPFTAPTPIAAPVAAAAAPDADSSFQQAQAQAVATQAIYESQGFPAAAARAAAQAMSGSTPSSSGLPAMQTGYTMQAMANFQQAATAAMQSAMQGMQSIPGVNMNQLAATPVGANAQQAYTDTMTALAMQQAAAAASQQFLQQGMPFMTNMVAAMQPPATTTTETTEGDAAAVASAIDPSTLPDPTPVPNPVAEANSETAL